MTSDVDRGAEHHADLGILLAMVYVAWADRGLHENELSLISEEARQQGLDEEELDELRRAILSSPDSLDAIANALPSKEARYAAAFSAFTMTLADHALTISELDAFDVLADALEIPESDRAEIRTLAEREVRSIGEDRWDDALLLERLLRPPHASAA